MTKLFLKELKNMKKNTSFLKILTLISLSLFVSFSANAQMECRSTLAAHLTPFHEKVPIYWAIEGTMAPGIMTSPYNNTDKTKLNGGMILGALDFSISKKHSFYIEGGYKNWQNSDFVSSSQSNRHLGMRQVFYGFTTKNTKVKLGLHEAKLGSFPLVDERIFGASIDQNIGAFTINARGGTVLRNFARMGSFCANRHLYGVINSNYTENIGKTPGETNLAGFALNWNPHYVKPKQSTTSDDEFSDTGDEFSGIEDEFSELTEPKQKVSVTNLGLILYDEFGSTDYIPDNKLYAGSIVDIDLPYGIYTQTGAIYQNMAQNNTMIYLVKLGKNFSLYDGSNTKISSTYIGKTDIDDNALFQPLFTNLFLGEIMRLDATETPLLQASIKHRFPGKLKFHMGVKVVGQFEGNKTNEQDLELGIMTMNNHLKLTLIGSRVETNALPNNFFMGRVELRLAF